MQRVTFLGLVCAAITASAYVSACAAEVADGNGDLDAGDESPPPSGPPVTYDSGPPANPYGNDSGAVTPAGDAASADGAPAVSSCTTPGDCPGNNAHDNVKCASNKCDLSCQGEFYDVNGVASDGCEKQDSPIDKHTQAKAVDLGSFGCTDGSSTQNIDGVIPADNHVHENPSVDGFNATNGAAPDWYKIEATGSGVCQNDANFDVQITGAKDPSCYVLTLITDKTGTQACGTDSNGKCSIGNGAGSYGNNSTVYLSIEKHCPAGTDDEAAYHISGHL